jgi:hypothetical protein
MDRIRGTQSIRKITKSMKMVAASKLRGDETRLQKGRAFGVRHLLLWRPTPPGGFSPPLSPGFLPCARSVVSVCTLTQSLLSRCAVRLPLMSHDERDQTSVMRSLFPQVKRTPDSKGEISPVDQLDTSAKSNLVFLITSDRGLCGGVNSYVCKAGRAIMGEFKKANKDAKLIVMGDKGRGQMARLWRFVWGRLSFLLLICFLTTSPRTHAHPLQWLLCLHLR